jgi:lupus La protein
MALIKKQVEFYFSDSNYRGDKFLKAASEEDPEGFVNISTLLTFNRLKALTEDASVVASALADSKTVVVSEDGLKLKRKRPLPEEDESRAKSLYAKGFPTDDETITIDFLTEWFSKHGSVVMIRMRKDHHRKFRGGVFVEFETKEEMEKAVECALAEPKVGSEQAQRDVVWKFKDTPLLCVMPMEEWILKHNAKKKRIAASKKEKLEKKGNAGKGDDQGSEKKRKRDEQDASEEKKEPPSSDKGKGLVIRVDGVPPESTLIELKQFFRSYGSVKYVEYEAGDATCLVRLAEQETVEKIFDAASGGLALKEGDETKLAVEKLEGEEEDAYWARFDSNVSNSLERDRSKGRGGGGRGRGRGGGGRGRGRGRGGGGNKRVKRDF